VIARLASALRRTGRIAVERPRAALWTTLALTCALLAVGIAGVTALTVERVVAAESTEGRGAGLVVYLGEGVTDERARVLATELQALPGVERIELVTAAESARRLVASFGSGAAMLEGVDVEALPASVEILLKPGVRDVVAMSPIIRELRGTAGVTDVVVEDASTAQSNIRVLGTVRGVAWIAAAVFAGLALLTALSSLRVRFDETRRGRHGEYSVVEMLGGGPSFVVIPTALAGALQSLLAAVLAGGLLVIGIRIYGHELPVELALPSAMMIAVFVGGSAAIGLLAGGLAGVSRTHVARETVPRAKVAT
jgi:cell division protein FtsX